MQAFDMIKFESSCKKTGVLIIFFVITIVFLVSSIKLAYAENKGSAPIRQRTIVIDPGHGGYDTGAQGPAGSNEKEVVLNLAQILAKELKPEYKVVLTRNGDYQADLTDRSSVANHHRADIFISIHTGGGNLFQMDAWSVYYYLKAGQQDGIMGSDAVVSDDRHDGMPLDDERLRSRWDQIQLRHQKKSRALAGCMKTPLAGNPKIREVKISGTSLRVLEGVDMPAIVIEAGYLTNPKTETLLNDTSFLTEVAKCIKTGVDVYLTR